MTASVTARTISRHYNAPPLNYIQAPSMIISRINNTKTIAASPASTVTHNTFLLFFYSQYFMGK